MPPQTLLTCISTAEGNEFIEFKKREDFLEVKENEKLKQEKKGSLLSAAQFYDLFNQTAVYNLIAFGLPVPFQLLFPIWTSGCGFYGQEIFNKIPSFSGFSVHNCNSSDRMDLEPGRCRRTDGRKWRCTKNVIPNQKYCERHMHRGRKGCSRKLVEPSEYASKPTNEISNFDDQRMSTTSLVTPNKVPSVPAQSDLELSILYSKEISCKNKDAGSGDIEYNFNKNLVVNHAGATSSTNLPKHITNKNHHNSRKIVGRKRLMHKNNDLGPGFGLSPNSVLQGGAVAGKDSLGLTQLDTQNPKGIEPQRCRRTDGKKWQCSRDVIPNQKYCEVHMHRGAKRVRLNQELTSIAATTSTQRSCNDTKSTDSSINLNIIPASPQRTSGNNSSSSTSDATTITDENVSVFATQSLHN